MELKGTMTRRRINIYCKRLSGQEKKRRTLVRCVINFCILEKIRIKIEHELL